MALFKGPVEKAEDELAVARRRVSTFEAARAKSAARETANLDFDGRFALDEELDLCDRKIQAAEREVESAERKLTTARNAEADAEGDRQHKAAEKLAAVAGERLTENVEAAVNQLVAALTALESNRAEVEAVDRKRGTRAPIADGEKRLRATPHRTEPAVFEERSIWRDASGQTPSQYRIDANGEEVPSQAGYVKRRERVQMRDERFIPGGMPTRYGEAIVLVNRKGDRIWPPAR